MNRSPFLLIIILMIVLSVAPANADPDDDPVQRAALMSLYDSAGGASWTNQGGWGTTSSYCSWWGITCDGNDSVLELRLVNNNLMGTIPPEIGNLSILERLVVPFNGLTGHIPPEIGALVNLKRLILGPNDFNGPIPPELGYLGNLESLRLNNNDLSGWIPAELANLHNLFSLILTYNLNLPCWETDAALEWADNLPVYQGPLSACGYIDPVQRGALMALYNSTDGPNWTNNSGWGSTSPYCYWGLVRCGCGWRESPNDGSDSSEGLTASRLESDSTVCSLLLEDNGLRGTIPPELGMLRSLGDGLYLNNNNLTGHIPPELGDLFWLNYLDLSGNQLSGSIPPEFEDLDFLVTLKIDQNNLSGIIPEELSNMDILYRLYLEGNQYLMCWETEAARDWAAGLEFYSGPLTVCDLNENSWLSLLLSSG